MSISTSAFRLPSPIMGATHLLLQGEDWEWSCVNYGLGLLEPLRLICRGGTFVRSSPQLIVPCWWQGDRDYNGQACFESGFLNMDIATPVLNFCYLTGIRGTRRLFRSGFQAKDAAVRDLTFGGWLEQNGSLSQWVGARPLLNAPTSSIHRLRLGAFIEKNLEVKRWCPTRIQSLQRDVIRAQRALAKELKRESSANR